MKISKWKLILLFYSIANESLRWLVCYLQCFKFTSFDSEQCFSIIKRFKTFQRYSLNNETLRNLIYIKYNSKFIDLNIDELNEIKEYESLCKTSKECLNSLTDEDDKLLEGKVDEYIEGDWGRRKENHVVGRRCNCWILIDCFHFIFVYLFFTI